MASEIAPAYLPATVLLVFIAGAGQTGELAHQILLRAHALGQGDALLLGLHQLRPAHQLGKVERPLVGRVIGTVVVAELALITEIDDLTGLTRGEVRGLLLVAIDRIEQGRK